MRPTGERERGEMVDVMHGMYCNFHLEKVKRKTKTSWVRKRSQMHQPDQPDSWNSKMNIFRFV